MAESLQDQIARQQADRKRELMRLALVEALREGMDRGDDQATIDSNLSRLNFWVSKLLKKLSQTAYIYGLTL